MDEYTQAKLNGYLELLAEVREQTQDERTAVALIQEISKDRRMEQMRGETTSNGDTPATENQKAYLERLGAVIPEGLTRQQASKLIDSTKATKQWGKKPIRAPVRIP